jgi:hypothetical protein
MVDDASDSALQAVCWHLSITGGAKFGGTVRKAGVVDLADNAFAEPFLVTKWAALYNARRELVAEDEREWYRVVAAPDGEVGAADSRVLDLQEDLAANERDVPLRAKFDVLRCNKHRCRVTRHQHRTSHQGKP